MLLLLRRFGRDETPTGARIRNYETSPSTQHFDSQISSVDFQTLPSSLSNFSQHQKASEDVFEDVFWDVWWQFGPQRMCWYEDKGARPEGSGCSVWTSAGAHGSRTQAKLGINMDVHQAPCPLPPCLSLCAATSRCVPVNSINSMAATSSHAKVINKHPQMAHNDSLQSDAAGRRVSRRVVAAHSSVCLTAYRLHWNKLTSTPAPLSGDPFVKLLENVSFQDVDPAAGTSAAHQQ